MTKAIVTLLFAVGFLLPASVSSAEDVYYIEIGHEATEEEALLQWQAYSEKYADVLKGLEFFPVTVLHQNDSKVGTRIQAGPLPAKLDAYRLCGRFIDDKVPCFIVEGRQKNKDEVASKPNISLPWLTAGQAAAFQPAPLEITETEDEPEQETGFFSWLFGNDEEEKTITPENGQPYINKKGEVQVAEAIRVPLTRENAPLITAKPEFVTQPESPMTEPQQAPERLDSGLSGAVWVNIRSFETDENASAFWQAVRANDPVQVAGLRVKIIRPFMETSQPMVSLNVGPFADQPGARAFCQDVIAPKNVAIRCEMAGGEAQQMAGSNLVSPRFEHGRRYEQRRKALGKRYNRRESSLLGEQNRTKIYWVQVAAAENQMEALKSWEDLRAQHPDLLEGLRSSVSATMMKGSKYMVRVGPLESGSAATELCTSLTGRGVPCRIYSNM
mgnify:CR=1 FL=1